ncbi:MAG TPA: PAS domain S-box protein [Dermatophilaceae bacterium]
MPSKTTRFEKLLEAVPDALVGMDQEGVIRFVNRQTESLFGYDRTDLIGQPIETLVPEPLWQIYAQNRDEYFADPRTRSSGLDLELTGRHRDGTDFPVNISMSQIDTGDVLVVVTAVRDVTSQRQAVQDAQLLAAVVEYSDDAIVGTTLEGLITSWNPAAERMYGYSSTQIIGRSGRILAYPGRADQMYAVLARIKAGEVVEHQEINHLRKDGTVFPVSVTVAPVRDEDGVIVGSSAVARDVTEQRRAFQTAQRMAAIIEDSDDAIISGSLDGRVTSWNPAAQRLYGYTAKEIVGKSEEFLTPEDQTGEIKAILAKIKDGQHIDHLETKRVRKDGTVFPVSLTVSPVRSAEGQVVGTSVIHRDMTQNWQTFESARAMIETSLDSFVVISPEGKITDANEATVRLTGVARDQLIGTTFSNYFTDPQRAAEIYQLVFTEGRAVEYPLTLRHRDETLTEVLYNGSVYRDASGTVLGVFAAARDVTKRIMAQREAAHQQAIELDRLAELERFHRLTVGRELKMIELKKEIEYLRKFGLAHADEPKDKH